MSKDTASSRPQGEVMSNKAKKTDEREEQPDSVQDQPATGIEPAAPEHGAQTQAAVPDERDERIAKLEGELSELKDQYLRKLADYENFRKRMFREKDDAVQFANAGLLAELVGVMDDFERAIKSSETSKDFQTLHDGVAMIERNLSSTLANKYGLSRFESVGQSFDPNRHEAMMSEQGDCDEPVVVEEYMKGYMLRERVLRSAKVKVRMPAAKTGADTATE